MTAHAVALVADVEPLDAEPGWTVTPAGALTEAPPRHPARGRPVGPLTPAIAAAWAEEYPPTVNRFNRDMYGPDGRPLPADQLAAVIAARQLARDQRRGPRLQLEPEPEPRETVRELLARIAEQLAEHAAAAAHEHRWTFALQLVTAAKNLDQLGA